MKAIEAWQQTKTRLSAFILYVLPSIPIWNPSTSLMESEVDISYFVSYSDCRIGRNHDGHHSVNVGFWNLSFMGFWVISIAESEFEIEWAVSTV